MQSRRDMLKGAGLSALFLGLARTPAFAAFARAWAPTLGVPPTGLGSLARSRPFGTVPDIPATVDIGGFPFTPHWLGDPWPSTKIPYHSAEDIFPGGSPPPPDEDVDIAIVGGGMSGMALAYLLKDRNPVLFELHDRFGGVSQGEQWAGTPFSMGGAYFIQPDPESWLARLYQELGLDRVQRFSGGGSDPVELGGILREDFWTGAGLTALERMAFERYARLVMHYAENYPEIPLVDGRDNRWILELDSISLREHITSNLGVPIPRLLAAGIEGYCYSSFDASWDQLSAAAGYNFLAAEEYGRWVCPGGNAHVTDVLWQRLTTKYEHDGTLDRLRPGTRVVHVDVGADGRPLLTYRQPDGTFRTLRARRAAMCCSKHIVKHTLARLHDDYQELYDAMSQVIANPYIVANVLLEAPIALDFYDLFLLEDGNFPFGEGQLHSGNRPIDVIAGNFPAGPNQPRSVLTLYWPLPWAEAPFTLLADSAFEQKALELGPHLRRTLALLGVPEASVRAVRLTRWGHAMPIARTRFLADGVPAMLRQPWRGSVYFCNQDNWALPAFETCWLEAQALAPRILAGL